MSHAIFIFGAGEAGKAALKYLQNDFQVLGFVDNDTTKQANKLAGLTVHAPEKLLKMQFDYIYVASEFFEQIERQLQTELAINVNKIRILPAHAIKGIQLGNTEANQNALKLLAIVTETLNKDNVAYYVDAGTLLGIVRDNALIPWDDDLDIAINSTDTDKCFQSITSLLERLELEFNTPWELFINKARNDYNSIHKGDCASFKLRPIKAQRKLAQLDVFIKYVDEELMHYVISSRGFTMPSSHLLTTEKYQFNNITLNLPSNATSYLATHYGDDWQTPKKDWNLSMIKSATVFES